MANLSKPAGTLMRYNWDSMFKSGRKFILKRGEHFNCMMHSMSIQIRTAARKHHKKVQINIDEEQQQIRVKVL